MTFQQLKAFVAITEAASFSSAAHKLYITPTALIQQINRLESEIGFALFIRSRTGVRLTDAGEKFYGSSVEIIAAMERALEDCRKLQRKRGNLLRVAAFTPDFSGWCKKYIRQNPGVEYHYTLLEDDGLARGLTMLSNNQIDILEGEYVTDPAFANLCFYPLRRTRVACMVASNHPLAARKYVTISDLERYVVYTYSFLNPVRVFIDETVKNGAKLTVNYKEYGTAEINSLCMDGNVFLLEEDYGKREFPLYTIPVKPWFHIQYGLYYRKKPTQITQSFLNFIAEK